jgi:hypothetical protein
MNAMVSRRKTGWSGDSGLAASSFAETGIECEFSSGGGRRVCGFGQAVVIPYLSATERRDMGHTD